MEELDDQLQNVVSRQSDVRRREHAWKAGPLLLAMNSPAQGHQCPGPRRLQHRMICRPKFGLDRLGHYPRGGCDSRAGSAAPTFNASARRRTEQSSTAAGRSAPELMRRNESPQERERGGWTALYFAQIQQDLRSAERTLAKMRAA